MCFRYFFGFFFLVFPVFSSEANAVIPAVATEIHQDQISPESLSAASLVRSK